MRYQSIVNYLFKATALRSINAPVIKHPIILWISICIKYTICSIYFDEILKLFYDQNLFKNTFIS